MTYDRYKGMNKEAILIPAEHLVDIIKGKREFKTTKFPEDAEFYSAGYDPGLNAFLLVLKHKSFKYTPYGCEAYRIPTEFPEVIEDD